MAAGDSAWVRGGLQEEVIWPLVPVLRSDGGNVGIIPAPPSIYQANTPVEICAPSAASHVVPSRPMVDVAFVDLEHEESFTMMPWSIRVPSMDQALLAEVIQSASSFLSQ